MQVPLERYRWAVERVHGVVVDVGCGCGYGTSILREKAITVGVDVSEGGITYARVHYPGPYIVANCEVQTFEGFDVVVCMEALSHFIDPYAWLKRLKVREIIVSSPTIPSKDAYPWRKHDIPEWAFEEMLTPKWEIIGRLEQENYLVLHARTP